MGFDVLAEKMVHGFDLIQKMEPRHEQAAVMGALVGGVQLYEAVDAAVHMAYAAAFVLNGQACRPARQCGEIEVAWVGDEFDLEPVVTMHFPGAGEAVDSETKSGGSLEGEPRTACCRMPH